MKKILHILSQIPSQTGSGIFFENLIRQCSRFGYLQSVIMGLPRDMSDYSIEGVSRDDTYEVLFETDQLPYKIPGMSDVMPYDSTVFSAMSQESFELYRNRFKDVITEAVLRFKPDIIISNHLWVATSAACEAVEELGLGADSPRVFVVSHGTDLRQMELSPKIRPYVTAACRGVAGVFSLNPYQSELINKLYMIEPERIHLIGTGYDDSIFHRTSAENDQIHKKIELVYAGKLARSKGLIELIKCMHILDPEVFRLTIAGMGSGSEADEILSSIDNPDVDIRYVGHLPQTELAELFRESDIFILPSYYEGLPLVVIEALASGMKVVVNELDGLREWLDDDINDSGRVAYVKMPKLKGLDTCDPAYAEAYIRDLAKAVMNSAAHGDKEPKNLDRYYQVIETRSWVNVFMRMERVFLP